MVDSDPVQLTKEQARYRNDAEYREKSKARAKLWRAENKERESAYGKEYRAKHKERVNARSRQWQKDNLESHREHSLAYYRKTGYKTAAKATAAYRAARDQRTPAWVDHEAINFFYECRPEGCHVDHVIPLRGERVSGLHVAENLQWLPAKDNLSKNNRYDNYDT